MGPMDVQGGSKVSDLRRLKDADVVVGTCRSLSKRSTDCNDFSVLLVGSFGWLVLVSFKSITFRRN